MSKNKTYTSDDVLAMCKEYMNEKHIQFIEKAIYFATFAHKEQVRKSGEAYIVHPIQVAGILAELKLDPDTIATGFLHDVVEDTDITIDDVGQSFGHQVAVYVDALTVSDTQDIMQSFARTAELGSEALSIRAADLIQNSYYYHLASTDMQKRLRDKFVYFMELSGELLDEALVSELSKAYRRNVETI